MATITANTALRTGPSFRARLGAAFSTYIESVARTDQVEHLNSLSDEALAAKGIRREDIVRYVYRDRLAF